MRETTEAIQAWNVYFEMGDERSLDKLSVKMNKTPSLLKKWSAAHKWQKRLEQHERQIAGESARRDAESKLKELDECRQERKIVARTLRAKAMRYIRHKELEEVIGADGKRITKALDVTRTHLALKMLDHADRAERLDMGEATERTENTTLSFDWTALMLDDPGEE